MLRFQWLAPRPAPPPPRLRLPVTSATKKRAMLESAEHLVDLLLLMGFVQKRLAARHLPSLRCFSCQEQARHPVQTEPSKLSCTNGIIRTCM